MDDSVGIYTRQSGYLDRYVQVGIAQGRVISVEFPNQPDEGVADEHDLLDRIEAYLEGERDEFEDVTVALTVPTDQRAVLEAVQQIPYGENATVEQIARLVPGLDASEDDDHLTVREALEENPVPVFIPSHRVRDGPGGMPPDIETKLRVLEGL